MIGVTVEVKVQVVLVVLLLVVVVRVVEAGGLDVGGGGGGTVELDPLKNLISSASVATIKSLVRVETIPINPSCNDNRYLKTEHEWARPLRTFKPGYSNLQLADLS